MQWGAQGACAARKTIADSLEWAFDIVSSVVRQLTTPAQSRREKCQQIVRDALESELNHYSRARERVVMCYMLAQPRLESDTFWGEYDEEMRTMYANLWGREEQDRLLCLRSLADGDGYQIDDAFCATQLQFNEIARLLARSETFIQAVNDVEQSYDISNSSYTQ